MFGRRQSLPTKECTISRRTKTITTVECEGWKGELNDEWLSLEFLSDKGRDGYHYVSMNDKHARSLLKTLKKLYE